MRSVDSTASRTSKILTMRFQCELEMRTHLKTDKTLFWTYFCNKLHHSNHMFNMHVCVWLANFCYLVMCFSEYSQSSSFEHAEQFGFSFKKISGISWNETYNPSYTVNGGYLSECLPFTSFFAVVILGRRTLECCRFSFALSYSLSDVRSVSLFAFCTTDCKAELALGPSATAGWDKQTNLVQN